MIRLIARDFAKKEWNRGGRWTGRESFPWRRKKEGPSGTSGHDGSPEMGGSAPGGWRIVWRFRRSQRVRIQRGHMSVANLSLSRF
jgi:hypothetical protein